MANGDYSFQISSLVVSLIRFNRINHDYHLADDNDKPEISDVWSWTEAGKPWLSHEFEGNHVYSD